ncbi:MEKHLA domain-containing protein [Dickeya zeae]|uniref:MEKHLA domain-containing protein n=1 Tax=Dickeya zeae TaxID=204042 RepID=UPI0003692F41|nr:MEKHLA domain-containing protein [Dickeya zeae]UJR53222.1 MEKHLA domain-containing protein [Dickeya zeae MS1]
MTTAEHLALLRRIDECYRALNGKELYCPEDVEDRYLWLDQAAPYSILAHSSTSDPVFIYANQCALRCFKYSYEEMLQLPSRLSASPADRAERQKLLDIVTRDGIAKNYTGPRVDKQGNTFTIYDGEVWQLGYNSGNVWGQAALFWPVPRKNILYTQ